MGKSQNNKTFKDKPAVPNGIRRNGEPKRSERKWWKEGYSGDYYPPDEYFENLEKMKENRRNNK